MRPANSPMIAVLSLVATLFTATSALAQDEPPPAPWKPMMRGGAGLEMYWFSAKDFGSTFPIIPYGIFAVSESVLLDVHFPLAIATNAGLSFGGDEKAGAGLGNPTVGITYVSTGERTSGYVGGRISAPLAGASDERTWQTATALAGISMLLYDVHYWAYKFVPIGLRAGIEHQPEPHFFVRGSIDPSVFVPLVNDNARVVGSRKAVFLYQMRLELEGRADSGWGGGAGLQLVHILSRDEAGDKTNSDDAQAALEPFASYESATTFARLGVVIGLDSPLGFGFDKNKVASLHLIVGSHF